MDRLSLIGSQDALILLRASFSAPRVQHLLRCSPLVDNAALTTFDDLLRSTVSLIMTYQTHSGSRHLADQRGLPWRETSCITYTSCLSSFSGEHSITPNHHSVEPSMCIWFLLWNIPSSLVHVQRPSPQQRKFPVNSQPGTGHVFWWTEQKWKQTLLTYVRRWHSGDWLAALPIAMCGLRLDDEVIRMEVALRLGLDLCVPVAVGHRSMRGTFMPWCVNTHQAEFKAPCPQWYYFPGVHLSWRSCNEGTNGTFPEWRQKPGWIDSHPVAEWEVIDMGCHGCHHASRLLYQCFSKFCWCCTEMVASRKSVTQVCGLASVVYLSADSALNAWSNEFFGYGILHCSGPQNRCVFDERDGHFFSAAIYGSAVLQRNFAAREFRWSRRTSSCSRFFVLISFLFNSRDLYYRWY